MHGAGEQAGYCVTQSTANPLMVVVVHDDPAAFIATFEYDLDLAVVVAAVLYRNHDRMQP